MKLSSCLSVAAVVAIMLLSSFFSINSFAGESATDSSDINKAEGVAAMQMKVTVNGKTAVFELNDSRASEDLLAQLPLDIEIENFGSNEKIFYPPKKLNTSDTPLAGQVPEGTLAYYAPWGDVVMFYKSFRPASGLYELGRVVSGKDLIKDMSGTARIEQ